MSDSFNGLWLMVDLSVMLLGLSIGMVAGWLLRGWFGKDEGQN